MHQKQEWMCLAAIEDPDPDVFVWIDYGVLKQHNMTDETITRFCERLKTRNFPIVEAPGISAMRPVNDIECWDRFCGSVVIEPRDELFKLARAMKAHAQKSIWQTGQITIESNTLAHVELAGFPIRWYPAWWGAQMFDNLPAA